MSERFSEVDYSPEFDGVQDSVERNIAADNLMEVRDAFRHIFSLPQGEIALTYLYSYCRQGTSTFVQGDPNESARREGMRRVYLQIAGFVMMTDETIYSLSQSQQRERDLR